MEFLSKLLEHPISLNLNNTEAATAVAVTTATKPTMTTGNSPTKLQIGDDDVQHGLIERNQETPSQNCHLKCKRNKIMKTEMKNESETTLSQSLIEAEEDHSWQCLPLTSTPQTNSEKNVVDLSESNHKLSTHDHQHVLLTPLKIDLKSSATRKLCRTPFASPTLTPTSTSSPQLLSTRNMSPSDTIEQLLIEINDNISQAESDGGGDVGGIGGNFMCDDVFNFNSLVRPSNQHSPLMATKAISPIINAKSVTAPITPTGVDGDDGISGRGTNLIPTNKMSQSQEKTTPITTIVDNQVRSIINLTNSDSKQQYSNLNHELNNDDVIVLNGHNTIVPQAIKSSITVKQLNDLSLPKEMNEINLNKLDLESDISPSKNQINDSQHRIEEEITTQMNFEECIIPDMPLNLKSIDGTSSPLSVSSPRGKLCVKIPSDIDTAPSSDNELFTDCTDSEMIEKDPLLGMSPIVEPLNDTNTDLDSYCSALNDITRNSSDNNNLNNTIDSIIDITMDSNESDDNNATLHVEDIKKKNHDSYVEEPMDVDMNVTLESLTTIDQTIITKTIENENNMQQLNEQEKYEIEKVEVEESEKVINQKQVENTMSKSAKEKENNNEINKANRELDDRHDSTCTIKALNKQEEKMPSISEINIKKTKIVEIKNNEEEENVTSTVGTNDCTKSSMNNPIQNSNQNMNVNLFNTNEYYSPKSNSIPKLDIIQNNQNEQSHDNQICKNSYLVNDSENVLIVANESMELKSENKRRTFNLSTSGLTSINDAKNNVNDESLMLTVENENNKVNQKEIEVENNRKFHRSTFNISHESNQNPIKDESEDVTDVNEFLLENEKSRRRTFSLSQGTDDGDRIIEKNILQEVQQRKAVATTNMNKSCEPMDIDDESSASMQTSSYNFLHQNEIIKNEEVSHILKHQQQPLKQANISSDDHVKPTEINNISAAANPIGLIDNERDYAHDNSEKRIIMPVRKIKCRPPIRDYKTLSNNNGNLSTKEANIGVDQANSDNKVLCDDNQNQLKSATIVQNKADNKVVPYDDNKNQINNSEHSSVMDDLCQAGKNNHFNEFTSAINSSDQQQKDPQEELTANCNDEEFEQQFNNNNLILQPYDFDYLLTRGNDNVPVVVNRSSLLLKFDPLIGAPVPVGASNQQHNQQQEQQHQQQLYLQFPNNNSNNNNNRLLSPTQEEEEEEEEEKYDKAATTAAKEIDQQKAESKETKVKEQINCEQITEKVNKEERGTCKETTTIANESNNEHNKQDTIDNKQSPEQENLKQNNTKLDKFQTGEPAKKHLQQQQQQQQIDITDKEKKRHAIMSIDVDVIKDMNLENCNKTYENSNPTQSEDKQQSNYKMDELEKKIKNEVLKTEDIEKKLKDAEQREEALIKRITEKDKTISKMNGVIEAYEKAIAECIAEKEQLIQNYEKQLTEVKTDRDSNYQHLASLETTFSDLHVKYEKSKEMTSHLKANEEEILAEKRGYMENLRLQEQRYEKMKSHAMQQLEIANKKLETLGKEHTTEITKLKALLKKEEIARMSITEHLTQKTKENAELMKICDELIQGQES